MTLLLTFYFHNLIFYANTSTFYKIKNCLQSKTYRIRSKTVLFIKYFIRVALLIDYAWLGITAHRESIVNPSIT